MPLDVRSVANFVLDEAERLSIPLTNIDINKICYFLHAEYLAKYELPLVGAKIEAWKYGPVFRELYSEFKSFGDQPITMRAMRINPIAARREICSLDSPEPIMNDLRKWSRTYMRLSTSQLIELSHIPDGPWDKVFNHEDSANPGMHISDEVIRDSFKAQVRH